MSALLKGFLKKEVTEAAKKAAAAAAGGGKKPPGNGGALFKQQGASVKGKSRLAEDSDVLAGSGPRRPQAERLEKQNMVSDPNYPSMSDVGSRGEKVNEGGQRVLNAVSKRRKINEKSVKAAQSAQEKISKEIARLEKQVKAIAADKSKIPAKRVADGLKVKNRIKDKKSLLQQARDKEANALGKTPKKSPRIPRTEMKAGGKITKKANGGRMSRVGLSPAEESRAGVMSEAARQRAMPRGTRIAYRAGGGIVGSGKIMHGYKKGGQV
tara:strand:+ start:1566 stop:2369 length:804 start_codon:yes stop_codon:yes gene_type:complete